MGGKAINPTPNRAIRVEGDLWERFEAAREAAGASDRSAIIREFIRWYVREPGAKMPKRPETPTMVEPAE